MRNFEQTKILYALLITINIIALYFSFIYPYSVSRLLIYLINSPISLFIALLLNYNLQSKRISHNYSSILFSLVIFCLYTYIMFAISAPGEITIIGLFFIIVSTILFQILFFYLICVNRKWKILALIIILTISLYSLSYKYFKTDESYWYLCFNVLLLISGIYSFVSYCRNKHENK